MKKVAILQSNYIPWKGYFDIISQVDEFILFDDMQYTKRDWRNRNLIKTPQGLQWLTVPVLVKGKFNQPIRETKIDGADWQSTHWKSLEQNYRSADHFTEIAKWLAPLYLEQTSESISDLNRKFLEAICNYLHITTKIKNSWDYQVVAGKTERLASICQQAGATEYISGPSARAYVDENIFSEMNIKLTWFEYGPYPTYTQLWGDFRHEVSILDLLFNCGRNAPHFMKRQIA